MTDFALKTLDCRIQHFYFDKYQPLYFHFAGAGQLKVPTASAHCIKIWPLNLALSIPVPPSLAPKPWPTSK